MYYTVLLLKEASGSQGIHAPTRWSIETKILLSKGDQSSDSPIVLCKSLPTF